MRNYSIILFSAPESDKGEKVPIAAAKKLSDGKSVIRETRNDIIRISSRS